MSSREIHPRPPKPNNIKAKSNVMVLKRLQKEAKRGPGVHVAASSAQWNNPQSPWIYMTSLAELLP